MTYLLLSDANCLHLKLTWISAQRNIQKGVTHRQVNNEINQFQCILVHSLLLRFTCISIEVCACICVANICSAAIAGVSPGYLRGIAVVSQTKCWLTELMYALPQRDGMLSMLNLFTQPATYYIELSWEKYSL